MIRSTLTALIAVFLAVSAVYAEEPAGAPAAPIRASIDRIRFDPSPAPARSTIPQVLFQPHKQTSLPTKITAGFVGAFLGFWAGGYVGARLEPPCACDDPGLSGFVIGAPIGAIAGGIAAVKLVSR